MPRGDWGSAAGFFVRDEPRLPGSHWAQPGVRPGLLTRAMARAGPWTSIATAKFSMSLLASIQPRIPFRGFGQEVFWLVLTFEAGLMASGSRELQIHHWTHENGLPGITVNSVAQTPDGYLWVGTFSGLARFDGVRFVSVDLGGQPGPEQASVYCLRADQQGNLWVGMKDGRLLQLCDGNLISHQPPSRQTGNRYLQRLTADQAEGVWTLNFEGGLCRLAEGRFTEVCPRREMVALVSDFSGAVWAAARDELFRSTDGRLTSEWALAREPGFNIEMLATAHAGGCWVAGNGRLRRFDGGRWRESRSTYEHRAASLTGFLEDREGRLWLSSYGGGIAVVERDGTKHRLGREEGLPSDLVRCLFEDREGNVWAGLEGRGLVRIRSVLFANYSGRRDLSDETVLSVCEGTDGEIWLGTNGDGVHRIGKNGQTRRYGSEAGLTNQFVWALERDHGGHLWAGTWGGGLYRLEGDRFVSFEGGPAADSVVLKLYEDRPGRLWLGLRTGPERVVATIENERMNKYTLPGTLARVEVRHIVESLEGSLWFGTTEEGLFRWKDGRFVSLASAPPGLSNSAITALSVDTRGDLWLAGDNVGLVRWKDERFETVVPPGDLPQTLAQITDDGLGNYWFASDDGVFRVSNLDLLRFEPGTGAFLNWQRFTKSDGLPSTVCNRGGQRMRDGRIWFCTLSGAAVLDPTQATPRPRPPPVLIEEAMVAGKRVYDRSRVREVNAAEPRSAPGEWLASRLPATLTIAPGGSPIDIHYTALNLASPEAVRFRHLLKGVDDTLVDAGSTRSVRYNHLPPGKFEFIVSARNEGGEWNETGAVLRLEVMPFYWQTAWFRTTGIFASVLLVAVVVALVLRARHRRRTERLEQVHAIERERSRIARDIHDELGGNLTEISFLGALAARESSPPAETREQVIRIMTRANEMTRALNEIVWAVNPKNDSLAGLSPYLCQFAQEFLEPTRIACRFDVQERLPDVPLSPVSRHNVFLVLKEALNNCVRHSGASEVRLSLHLPDREFVMRIDDNGCGFAIASAAGPGNGLHNMRQRAESSGARLLIRSQPGMGTTVSFLMPLERVPAGHPRGLPHSGGSQPRNGC